MKAEITKRYKHYKKGDEYTVLNIARLEETAEEVVVYRAEYDTEDFGPRPVWVRKKDSFEGQVEYEGKLTDRFTRID